MKINRMKINIIQINSTHLEKDNMNIIIKFLKFSKFMISEII